VPRLLAPLLGGLRAMEAELPRAAPGCWPPRPRERVALGTPDGGVVDAVVFGRADARAAATRGAGAVPGRG
jgi:hypothetical protein